MAKKNMTLRIDPDLKEQAAALFKALGMDLSTATGIFYRQALRCHGLPFEVCLDEPNETTYQLSKRQTVGRSTVLLTAWQT